MHDRCRRAFISFLGTLLGFVGLLFVLSSFGCVCVCIHFAVSFSSWEDNVGCRIGFQRRSSAGWNGRCRGRSRGGLRAARGGQQGRRPAMIAGTQTPTGTAGRGRMPAVVRSRREAGTRETAEALTAGCMVAAGRCHQGQLGFRVATTAGGRLLTETTAGAGSPRGGEMTGGGRRTDIATSVAP
jgi:hypothetical protein